MLVSVYNYCVMVKSVSCCCVRGNWIFSNPVTYVVVILVQDHLHTHVELTYGSQKVVNDSKQLCS